MTAADVAGVAPWAELVAHFAEQPGQRAILVVAAERISDSCGYAVPRMDFVEERERLATWASSRSDEELVAYRSERNDSSIDGLPGL